MNYFAKQQPKVGTVTGTCSGASVGAAKNGTTIAMNNVTPLTLSAYVDIAITTGSFTLTPKWQVSQDNSTFVTALVGIGAGISAVAATATSVYEAPRSVYGWPYARMILTVGGATGAGTETYDIRYTYLGRPGSP